MKIAGRENLVVRREDQRVVRRGVQLELARRDGVLQRVVGCAVDLRQATKAQRILDRARRARFVQRRSGEERAEPLARRRPGRRRGAPRRGAGRRSRGSRRSLRTTVPRRARLAAARVARRAARAPPSRRRARCRCTARVRPSDPASPARGPPRAAPRHPGARGPRVPRSPRPISTSAMCASNPRSPAPIEPQRGTTGVTSRLRSAMRRSSTAGDTPAPPSAIALARASIAARTWRAAAARRRRSRARRRIASGTR